MIVRCGFWLVGVVGAFVVGVGCAPSQQPVSPAEAGAKPLSADPDRAGLSDDSAKRDDWENLLPPPTLDGFRRVPLDPLAQKPVWQVRADGTLFIDGAGAKEMLLSEREFADGVLHIEWRFVPSAPAGAGEPVYNGGVYVRTALDGKSWVQLQVAHAEKPPVVGDLIAQVPGSEKRVEVFQNHASSAAPVGEWNTYDISAHGSTIELRVNGQTSVAWSSCPIASGHVGLQAEGAPIEVRALRFRPR
jgi:hypothetical protein